MRLTLLTSLKEGAQLLSISFLISFFGFISQIVSAQSGYDPTNKYLYPHYDPSLDCSYNQNNSSNVFVPGQPLAEGSSVYILGDSITNQSISRIREKVEAYGYILSKINADGGRALSEDTFPENSPESGFKAVADDAAIIAESDAIVIALGTNSGNEKTQLAAHIGTLVTAVRSANADIKLYWVNMFYDYEGSDADIRNAVIENEATALGVNILDASSAGIELSLDGRHPTSLGAAQFADVIAKGLKVGGSSELSAPSSPGGNGGINPLALTYPNITNEVEMARKFTERLPAGSPWVNIKGNKSSFGEWLIEETKKRNINPFAFMSVGKQENGFGTGKQVQVVQYFNYFGMKGTTPIDIPNSEYRGFSSGEEGITFYMDKFKRDTTGQNEKYAGITNFYEYISVHQTGQIAYPPDGEFDPDDVSGPVFDGNGNVVLGRNKPDGNTKLGYDPSMGVYISWDEVVHPNKNPEYVGAVYNPLTYFRNSIELINELTGLSLSDIPVRGAGALQNVTCNSAGTSGTGLVDAEGYTFPIAPQTQQVGGTETGHWDGTPAFDLFGANSDGGDDVYAISAGVPVTVRTTYKEQVGCSTIQFKSDDGFYYWYGHLQDVIVEEGVHIDAGTIMAKTATRPKFNSVCWGGAPHLHIDRGCVIGGVPQRGGRDECRDPDFIPFLRSKYKQLPVN